MSDPSSGPDLLAQLAEEFAERYRRGERPCPGEYADRHPELAADIRALFPALVALEEVGSVGGPAAGPDPGAGAGPEAVPRRLGDFRILRELGRGGMGVVYEAVQESLGRHVALKVLLAHGRLDAHQLERFQREARAAARLHHTNIVPVFGVGEYQGVPYYAMQFIPGQPLDAVARELQRLRARPPAPRGAAPPDPDLTTSAARGLLAGGVEPRAGGDGSGARTPGAATLLSLTGDTEPGAAPDRQYFRSVARVGVQVGEALAHAHQHGIVHRDIKPGNLLLDGQGTVWVADFGLAKAEGGEELTVPGDVVGTLRYLAPERFSGPGDARSDVYSLGLTLYELLTLKPAFTAADRARLIERVLHEDPPRPRRLDSRIPRDLETIVLKASAREPQRRYQSAGALAEDLNRFLADQPIRARRAGLCERLAKWAKRRPAAAALAGLSVLFVLIALAGAWWHIGQLNAALHEVTEAQKTTKEEEAKAKKAAQRAMDSNAQKDKAVDRFLTHLGESRLAKMPWMEPLRKKLLEEALTFFQEDLKEKGGEPGVRHQTARAYRRVADICALLGKENRARAAFGQALGLYERLVAESPRDPVYRKELAHVQQRFGIALESTGRLGEAMERYRLARDLLRQLARESSADPSHRSRLASVHVSLGIGLRLQGRLVDAEREQREALRLHRQLAAAFPKRADSRRDLGFSYYNLGMILEKRGRYPEAERALRQALTIRVRLVEEFKDEPEYWWALAHSYNYLGLLLRHSRRFAEAERAFRDSLGLWEKVEATFPAVPEYVLARAGAHSNLGTLLEETDRLQEAEFHLRRAVTMLKLLVKGFPAYKDYQLELASCQINLANLLARTGKTREAEEAYRAAEALFQKLADRIPNAPAHRARLADTHTALATLLGDTGRPREAEEVFARARRLFDELTREFPRAPEYRACLARCLNNLGNFQKRTGQFQQAEQTYRQAREVWARLVRESPKEPRFQHKLARSSVELGLFLRDRHRLGEAEEVFREALKDFEKLAADFPGPDARGDLARCLYNLGELLQKAGRPADAGRFYRRCVAERQKLVDEFPKVPEYRHLLAGSEHNYANFLSKAGRLAEAEPNYRKALERWEGLLKDDPGVIRFRRGLVIGYGNLARLLDETDRPHEAEQTRRRAAELRQKLPAAPPGAPAGGAPVPGPIQPGVGRNLREAGIGHCFASAGDHRLNAAAVPDQRQRTRDRLVWDLRRFAVCGRG